MLEAGESADVIVTREGLAQNSDEDALVAIVRDVVAQNADAVAQYRAGQMKTFGFLVGQVMKNSGGKANPKLANQLLRRESTPRQPWARVWRARFWCMRPSRS
jgi:aspartyl-tRNA(Asn)/glutamyl-tRNA(Gln) amidotransferase subunit B